MPNAKRGLSGSKLDEQIVQIGLSMRLAGFGPMTREEVVELLETTDGGTTPITNAKPKDTFEKPMGAIPMSPPMMGGM